MPISIGCAVWSYPGWVGEVYPPKTQSKDFLRVYSHHFLAVEGNTTFYATPDRVTIDRWIAQTPQGFKFCLKFPRAITHNGLLEPLGHIRSPTSRRSRGSILAILATAMYRCFGSARWDA